MRALGRLLGAAARSGPRWGFFHVALAALLLSPGERLALAPGFLARAHLVLYSVSFWAIAFTGLDLFVRALLAAFPRWRTSTPGFALRFLHHAPAACLVAVGHFTWAAYSGSPPLMHRELMEGRLLGAVPPALAAGVAGALALALLFRKPRAPAGSRAGWLPAALALAYVVLSCALPGLPRPSSGPAPPAPEERRIVLLGIDAGSWNVLLPAMARGDLPSLSRLRETGAFGYLDTHGIQFTPPAWTSIATGRTADGHGVRHFGAGSADWKAAPVWSAFSSQGRRVSVIHWICAWPPFDVNGLFVSSLLSDRPGRVHLAPRLEPRRADVERILSECTARFGHTDRPEIARQESWALGALDREVVSPDSPHLAVYYFRSTDPVQHFRWQEIQPERFRAPEWPGALSGPAEVQEVWRRADELLGSLLETHGEDAYYIVVSDHGARPVEARAASFDIVPLLVRLGLAILEGDEPDSSRSRCIPVRSRGSLDRVSLRLAGDEDSAEVAGSLAAVAFADGAPLFRRLRPRGPLDLDLFLAPQALDLSRGRDPVVVAGESVPLARFQRPHPWSGRHRARGIFLARGPTIRRTHLASWLLDEPWTAFVAAGRGVLPAADRLSPVLSALHAIDRATTLDIAPTLLRVAGLPVSRAMDGRVLTEILSRRHLREEQLRYVDDYPFGKVLPGEDAGEGDREMEEQLRALGYIQ